MRFSELIGKKDRTNQEDDQLITQARVIEGSLYDIEDLVAAIKSAGLEYLPGEIRAGGRKVRINKNGVEIYNTSTGTRQILLSNGGIQLNMGASNFHKIRYLSGSTVRGEVFVTDPSDENRPRMRFTCYPAASNDGEIKLNVYATANDESGMTIDHSDSADGEIKFYINTPSGTALAMDKDGIAFFSTADFGGGVQVVFIQNATTVPSSNPTGGGILYTDSGALKYRGSSGTTTTIANA